MREEQSTFYTVNTVTLYALGRMVFGVAALADTSDLAGIAATWQHLGQEVGGSWRGGRRSRNGRDPACPPRGQ